MTELRLGLPSKGTLHDATVQFLAGCGLAVVRSSNRHYLGELAGMGPVQVLFLHAGEVPAKVADGTCDLGITGIDLVRENANLARGLVVPFPGLGYGKARLVVAVPDTWRDVDSLADLVELAAQWRSERGAKIRVATKFPGLTRQFLLAAGISDHAIVRSSGATELSGWLRDADLIADLTSTGSTLTANRLKEIDRGTILETESCLVASRAALAADEEKREAVRRLLDRIEGRLRARKTYVVSVVCDRARWEASRKAGPLDPWLVQETPAEGEGIGLTLHVPRGDLDSALLHLRKLGLWACRVVEPAFLFTREEAAYHALLAALKHGVPED
jgi:ATP phosphoribosyltransferase